MNRQKFFDSIRPHFPGRKLDAEQVAGIESLLEAGRDLPLHYMANVLANVRRETGAIMAPIKETVKRSDKNRNPTDATVKQRLTLAWKRGQLPWVTSDYWSSGWFGRGQIQITHERNYRKFGITNPADALKPDVSARIAVDGMSKGVFTGRKLSDYEFPQALAYPVARNPRRIVNGEDGSDAEVAGFHRQFAGALEQAGWGQASKPVSRPPEEPAPVKAPPGWLTWLLNILKGRLK